MLSGLNRGLGSLARYDSQILGFGVCVFQYHDRRSDLGIFGNPVWPVE